MNGRIDSGLGQIIIDTDVIATYAGSVAVECFGIVGMAAVSMKDGLVKLLGKNSLKHGISVRITEDNKIRLNFHVIVAYGVNNVSHSHRRSNKMWKSNVKSVKIKTAEGGARKTYVCTS